MERPQFKLWLLFVMVGLVAAGIRLLLVVYTDLGWRMGLDYWPIEAAGIGAIGAAAGIPFKRPLIFGGLAVLAFLAFITIWYSS